MTTTNNTTANNNVIFPNNIRGTYANWNNESHDVFICGEYHGRYEDDDASFLVWNMDTKKFRELVFSTRWACSAKDSIDTPVIDVNNVSDDIINEIKEAARKLAHEEKNIKNILYNIKTRFECNYPKSYSKKSVAAAIATFTENIHDYINETDDFCELISLIYDEPYSGYSMGGHFISFVNRMRKNHNIVIKDHIDRKPMPIKLYGENYEGKVVSAKYIPTMYGTALKLGIVPNDNEKSVWAIVNDNTPCPNVGDIITINGLVRYESEKSISLEKAKRIDHVDAARLVKVA